MRRDDRGFDRNDRYGSRRDNRFDRDSRDDKDRYDDDKGRRDDKMSSWRTAGGGRQDDDSRGLRSGGGGSDWRSGSGKDMRRDDGPRPPIRSEKRKLFG